MYRVEKLGKGCISAKVVADSVCSQTGTRITTFELEYPRFIHCFDKETEILSKIGDEPAKFRSFEEVFHLGAKVAQYRKDNKAIEFVYPEKTIKQEGNFKMVKFEKDKLSMCVTDKHRVYLDKRTTDNEFKPTEALAEDMLGNYGTVRIPKAGLEFQKQILSSSEIELIAWYVADGHKENHKTSNFHLKKERKIRKVCDLLSECGLEFSLKVYGDNHVIRFDSPWWVDKCYNDDKEKVLPKEATQMTQECYPKFKQALLESDGNVDNQEYNTSSKELAEQIQSIALLHGDAMNIRKYSCGIYKQTFQKTNYISLRQDKDKFETSEEYTTVYCVTVPSSFVVVRRKGIAYISGNCELMTHRMFSRNAASSRAIPVEKMLEQIRTAPASPVHWGANQSGMQAEEESNAFVTITDYFEADMPTDGLYEEFSVALDPEDAWLFAASEACKIAKAFSDAGYHKQIVNRLLEPFQIMKTVVTATEWNNFWYLRAHKDAQPEIQELAVTMKECYELSEPIVLKGGDWHTPYYKTGYWVPNSEDLLADALAISSSCCAQVSFRALDDSLDKAKRIYDRLVSSKPVHASPFEHQATPMSGDVWDAGTTHKDAYGELWSGNFKNWVQHRQVIKDNVVEG